MIQEIKDRVPVNVLSNDAIRYGIYDEQGNLARYEYIKREDEPIETGTPINKILFNNLQGDLYAVDRYNKPTMEREANIKAQVNTTNFWPSDTGWTKVTAYTAYEQNGFEVTASSALSSGYRANYAFRPTTDSYWGASSYSSANIMIKMPIAYKVRKMTMRVSTEYNGGTVMGANFNGAVIQGSFNGANWINLYTISQAQSEATTVVLNNPDKYLYYRILFNATAKNYYPIVGQWSVSEWEKEVTEYTYKLNLGIPLTSYETGKIVNIEGTSYSNITSFANPYININNLGAKQINGTLKAGEKYSLIYNGKNFDIFAPKDYVAGVYTGDGTFERFINLGFTPKAVIVSTKDNIYTSEYGGIAIEGYPVHPNDNYSRYPVKIVEGGFTVSSGYDEVHTNDTAEDRNPYRYVAFK